MKIMILITTLLFASLFASAQTATPTPTTPPLPASVEDGKYISVHSGYGMMSSSLSGSGFNSDLGGEGGAIFGAEFSYKSAGSDVQYKLSYEKTSLDQDAPAGVTPTSLTVFREDFRFLMSFAPWDSGRLENFRVGLGYGVLGTGATNTTPNNVLTNQLSQGALFNLSYQSEWHTGCSLGSELLIYLPHQIQESAQVTGYNPKFIGAELKLTLDYLFSNQVSGFIGASYRVDQVTYEGSVSRGVTDGQDTRNMFAIPIGLKIGY
jgi:opacity protein-like surface antigen